MNDTMIRDCRRPELSVRTHPHLPRPACWRSSSLVTQGEEWLPFLPQCQRDTRRSSSCWARRCPPTGSLSIPRAHPAASGTDVCQVDQHRLDALVYLKFLGEAQLAEDSVDVLLHRPHGQEQRGGD